MKSDSKTASAARMTVTLCEKQKISEGSVSADRRRTEIESGRDYIGRSPLSSSGFEEL